MTETFLSSIGKIPEFIFIVRGQKVMLDRDLARLYGVETRVLIQAVKRNMKRFPSDFMLQFTKEEFENWRKEVRLKDSSAKMSLRRRPYAFTEQGVAMLSTVLNSERAIRVNIEIMRVFVSVRETLITNTELSQKMQELEQKVGKHDKEIAVIFKT